MDIRELPPVETLRIASVARKSVKDFAKQVRVRRRHTGLRVTCVKVDDRCTGLRSSDRLPAISSA